MSNVEKDAGEFPVESLEQLRRRVGRARAMLRSVIVAIRAIDDGSVNFGSMEVDADAQRWSPITNAAREELIAVRDTLMNSLVDSPADAWDWVTPLAQIEALDAALWYGGCTRSGDGLENFEVSDAAEAIVGSLDKLLEQDCASTLPGVSQAAAVAAH